MNLETISNGFVTATFLDYGALIRDLVVTCPNGEKLDVVLGYDSEEEYKNDKCCFGRTVGRYANRIKDGHFSLNGIDYQLDINDGVNHLHGGREGMANRYWELVRKGTDFIEYRIEDPDGFMGFPGALEASVMFRLCGNSISIEYKAVSNADTIVNLTNHSYFNLNGQGNGDIKDHSVVIHASKFMKSKDGIPNGPLDRVEDEPSFDFRTSKTLRRGIEGSDPELTMYRGYDHNFVLDSACFGKVCEVTGDKSGLTMEVFTDKPGVQLYTGNGIEQGLKGKNGAVYGPYSGVCFETQFHPDTPNHPEYPSCLLKRGEPYSFTTVYNFI